MIENAFSTVRDWLTTILPLSPFQQFLDKFSDIPYLPYLNWFVPISDILTVLAVWLVSVGGFYLYSILLRWLKVLGD